LLDGSEDEEALRKNVVEEISKIIPPELVETIVSSYERLLLEYRKGCWEETLWKAGRFAENTFRILAFLLSGKVEKEAPNFTEVKAKLQNSPADQLPESVRLLIPRIASSLIYDPRSKRGAVHVQEVDPSYLDANLVVSGCSWILAEFVRLYHTSDTKKVVGLVNDLAQRKVPFVEVHEGEVFVVRPLDCQSEILLLLLNSPNGLDRRHIGVSSGRFYTPGRITQALQELEGRREILKVGDKFIISGSGDKRINKVLSRIA
jgi:hypothetical protein